MAFTIQQLQDFSNTKPELRYITEEIIDYLEANPPGGSPSLGYSSYVATLTQAGTNAPVANEFVNTAGFPAWTRISAGVYELVSGAAINKLFVPGYIIDANDDGWECEIFAGSSGVAGANLLIRSSGIIQINVMGGIDFSTNDPNAIFCLPEIRIYD